MHVITQLKLALLHSTVNERQLCKAVSAHVSLITTPQDLKSKAEGYLQQGLSQKNPLHVSSQLKIFQFTWLWIKNSNTSSGSAN